MIIEMMGVTKSSAFQKLEDESNVLSSDHRNLSTEHTEDTDVFWLRERKKSLEEICIKEWPGARNVNDPRKTRRARMFF